jgi:hypothetical protein
MQSRQISSTTHTPPYDPYQTISSFCQSYQLPECRAHLWDLLSAAFSSENADSWNAMERGDLLFFCKNIDALLQASFQITQQEEAV